MFWGQGGGLPNIGKELLLRWPLSVCKHIKKIKNTNNCVRAV